MFTIDLVDLHVPDQDQAVGTARSHVQVVVRKLHAHHLNIRFKQSSYLLPVALVHLLERRVVQLPHYHLVLKVPRNDVVAVRRVG